MDVPPSPAGPQQTTSQLTGDGRDGYPPVEAFAAQIQEYLDALNPRKRDKALVRTFLA